jgi:nucleoid-associated protein YgaU
MAGKIFVNYRRGDDPGFTQALYQRLEDEFTADDLFMDVEGHIKPGDDFVAVLNAQVEATDVVLAVIGPRWSELLAARANDPDDFVAIEIKAALGNNKRVIPVLVGGASMPRADLLPEAIKPLARRNAVGLRPERFKADCQGLITALKEQLAAAETERTARSEAERTAAETARREAEAQAAARAQAAEERSRAQAAAGLSGEEIRKAEELANWEFVKDRNDVQDLRDHLARFPGGTTERYAVAKLDQLVWAALGTAPNMTQLRRTSNSSQEGRTPRKLRHVSLRWKIRRQNNGPLSNAEHRRRSNGPLLPRAPPSCDFDLQLYLCCY